MNDERRDEKIKEINKYLEELDSIKPDSLKNFISHQYGEVDDELVFNAINKELEKDVASFINKTKK